MSERSGPFWDAAMGHAPMPRAAATLGLEFLDFDPETATVELKASFLRPGPAGPDFSRGRVVHRHGDLAFLEAALSNPDGEVVSTATATARIIALSEARTEA
jgi:acyl-coenzyme A thioesterase PaaI-like protein